MYATCSPSWGTSSFYPENPVLQPPGHHRRLCTAGPGDRPSDPRLFPFGPLDTKGRRFSSDAPGGEDQCPDREQGGHDPRRCGPGLSPAAHHERFRALILDGIIIKRKTGAGTLTRPVLVALGIRHDGKKEVIDFRLAKVRERKRNGILPHRSRQRGLSAAEVICADGGEGLISSFPRVSDNPPSTLLGA